MMNKRKKPMRGRRRKKGMALAITLVILSLVSIMAFGMITLSVSQSKTTDNFRQSQKAYYLARIGVSKALIELKMDYWWSTSAPYSNDLGDQGEYTVSVWAPMSNMTSSRKIWKVTSTGEFQGAKRVLEAWIEQESFAIFGYFSSTEHIRYWDPWRDRWSTTDLWVVDDMFFTGRVHCNNVMNFIGHPDFDDKVTTANADDSRYNQAQRRYQQGGETYYDPSMFYRYKHNYASDGPEGVANSNFLFAGGQPEVELEGRFGVIEENADMKFNKNIWLTFNEDGTVTIKYSSEDDEGDDDEGGNDAQPEDPITETVNSTNLTIYTSENVYIEGGKVTGAITVGAEKKVYLNDNFTYKDPNVDILGIATNYGHENDREAVIVNTTKHRPGDFEMCGAIFIPNGSLTVRDWHKPPPRGALKLTGGLVQNFGGITGACYSNGNLYSGYHEQYTYDRKLPFREPPNFPTTGKLKVVSLKDSGALGNDS